MNLTVVGETAVILSISGESTRECVVSARRIKDRILKLRDSRILSVRCGLDAVLVEFRKGADPQSLLDGLSLNGAGASEAPAKTEPVEFVEIPVCYEQPHGKDLDLIVQATGLNREKIIELHTAGTYEVWMMGFMPGFSYLGALPGELQVPRKTSPELLIPAGSVAIADEYVGIYPFDSPGGWNVIGRTPYKMVDYSNPKPWKLEPGQLVRFYPIASDQWIEMRQ